MDPSRYVFGWNISDKFWLFSQSPTVASIILLDKDVHIFYRNIPRELGWLGSHFRAMCHANIYGSQIVRRLWRGVHTFAEIPPIRWPGKGLHTFCQNTPRQEGWFASNLMVVYHVNMYMESQIVRRLWRGMHILAEISRGSWDGWGWWETMGGRENPGPKTMYSGRNREGAINPGHRTHLGWGETVGVRKKRP